MKDFKVKIVRSSERLIRAKNFEEAALLACQFDSDDFELYIEVSRSEENQCGNQRKGGKDWKKRKAKKWKEFYDEIPF